MGYEAAKGEVRPPQAVPARPEPQLFDALERLAQEQASEQASPESAGVASSAPPPPDRGFESPAGAAAPPPRPSQTQYASALKGVGASLGDLGPSGKKGKGGGGGGGGDGAGGESPNGGAAPAPAKGAAPGGPNAPPGSPARPPGQEPGVKGAPVTTPKGPPPCACKCECKPDSRVTMPFTLTPDGPSAAVALSPPLVPGDPNLVAWSAAATTLALPAGSVASVVPTGGGAVAQAKSSASAVGGLVQVNAHGSLGSTTLNLSGLEKYSSIEPSLSFPLSYRPGADVSPTDQLTASVARGQQTAAGIARAEVLAARDQEVALGRSTIETPLLQGAGTQGIAPAGAQ